MKKALKMAMLRPQNKEYEPMEYNKYYRDYGEYDNQRDNFSRIEHRNKMSRYNDLNRNYRHTRDYNMGYDDDDDEYYKFRIKGRMSSGKEPEKLTKEVAETWTKKMKNVDGTSGPHWSMEQIEQLRQQRKELQEYDPVQLYAVLNMMFSDYREVGKKFNIDNLDFYLCLAKAWINDNDSASGEDKTLNYYKYVVV